MDVREKLVELLNEVQETGVNEIPAGFGCTRQYISNERVAAHLISHGVTVHDLDGCEYCNEDSDGYRKKIGTFSMYDLRKDCPMRHENGNCTVAGGFCTSVNDPICEALHNAYDCGYRHSALREQEERRWIPVAERLPDKPMRCLVYTKRGEYGGYEITYYNQGFYTQYAEVTHWMQLPELPQPPKEEDSK